MRQKSQSSQACHGPRQGQAALGKAGQCGGNQRRRDAAVEEMQRAMRKKWVGQCLQVLITAETDDAPKTKRLDETARLEHLPWKAGVSDRVVQRFPNQG